MSPRPLGPYFETPGSYGHRSKSRWLWLPVVALLLAVFAFIAGILPRGPVSVLSDRSARKKLAEAEARENTSLNILAAEAYSSVAESVRVSPALRVKAARGMARVYRAIPGHAEDVEHGLEIAYILSPPGEEKDAIKNELETKRGRPLTSVQTSTSGQTAEDDGSVSTTLVTLPPLPRKDHILARIGDESVSTEEILDAWHRSTGRSDEPGPAELKPFVRIYLDSVLLADEARRRGLDRQPETTYDLRRRRFYGLEQAITDKLIKALSTPDVKTLEAYYNSHKEIFITPERVLIGHIVVKTPDDKAKVTKALDQGQRFDKVAGQYSADAKQLQSGYLLGWISKADSSVPGFGYNPALVQTLVAMKDGDTTGPISSQLGIHWYRVVSRTPAKLRPFSEVQKFDVLLSDVMLSYQKSRLAEARQKLLQQLRQDRTIEIVDPAMRAHLDEGGDEQAEVAPAGGDAATTDTQASDEATTETEAGASAAPAATSVAQNPQDPEGKSPGAAQTRAQSAR